MASRPGLIFHTPGGNASPAKILEKRAYLEGLPMDGMGVQTVETWTAMEPGVVVDRSEVREELQQLREFNEGLENYLVVFVDRPGDLFDDAAWAQAAENWRVIAEEARAAGFEGIHYDNEEYGPTWQNFPDDHPGATADELPAYQAQASKRGKQMMEALAEGFPDAEIGVHDGPYKSLEEWGRTDNELLGPFFTGMLEGVGPDQTFRDMGEQYHLRTEERFEYAARTRGDYLAERIDWDMPDEVRETYGAEVIQEFMVNTQSPPPYDVPMNPAILTETLGHAFANTQDNVYLYWDAPMLDWFEPGDASREWTEAVERAVAVADARAGGGGEMPAPEAAAPAPGADDDGATRGGDGADRLDGGAGNDDLRGGGGDDVVRGGGGNDVLVGGDGDDRLYGGAGDDMMTGGGWDRNTFVLGADGDGADTITDVDVGVDGGGGGGGGGGGEQTFDQLLVREGGTEAVLSTQAQFLDWFSGTGRARAEGDNLLLRGEGWSLRLEDVVDDFARTALTESGVEFV